MKITVKELIEKLSNLGDVEIEVEDENETEDEDDRVTFQNCNKFRNLKFEIINGKEYVLSGKGEDINYVMDQHGNHGLQFTSREALDEFIDFVRNLDV